MLDVTSTNSFLKLSSYVPGASSVSATVSFGNTNPMLASAEITIEMHAMNDATFTATQFTTATTAIIKDAGVGNAYNFPTAAVPTLPAQPIIRPGAGWAAGIEFNPQTSFRLFSVQHAQIKFTVSKVAATGQPRILFSTGAEIIIEGLTLPTAMGAVRFTVTRTGNDFAAGMLWDGVTFGGLCATVGACTTGVSVVHPTAFSLALLSNLNAAGNLNTFTGTGATAAQLASSGQNVGGGASSMFNTVYLQGVISKAHSWYSNSVTDQPSTLYVSFTDTAEISIGDVIYAVGGDMNVAGAPAIDSPLLGTNLAVTPVVTAVQGFPAATTLSATAQNNGASLAGTPVPHGFLISVTVGGVAVPANTMVRFGVDFIKLGSANVLTNMAAHKPTFVATTKSGSSLKTTAYATCVPNTPTNNVCPPLFEPTAVIVAAGVSDFGACISAAGTNVPTAITATQTSNTPLAANTLTLTFSVGSTAVVALGNNVYVYMPGNYAASMSTTQVVSGVSMVVSGRGAQLRQRQRHV